MQWQLPAHLGGDTVELETDGMAEGERVIGWMDDQGTITDNDGRIIGDLVLIEGRDIQALVMKDKV